LEIKEPKDANRYCRFFLCYNLPLKESTKLILIAHENSTKNSGVFFISRKKITRMSGFFADLYAYIIYLFIAKWALNCFIVLCSR
jgi:hypothetical protein